MEGVSFGGGGGLCAGGCAVVLVMVGVTECSFVVAQCVTPMEKSVALAAKAGASYGCTTGEPRDKGCVSTAVNRSEVGSGFDCTGDA